MLTRDLIRDLCAKLDHEDKTSLIVKKLVQDNWLEKVEDLHYVPRSRLEHWQVPLKLIEEVYDFVIETEATAVTTGISAFVNYSLRPTIDQYMSGPIYSHVEWLRDDAEKRNNPDVWAAKRMQRWYRRRKRRRLQEKDVQLMTLALMECNDSKDFKNVNRKENTKRCQQRAAEKIEVAMRLWTMRWRAKRRYQKAVSCKDFEITVQDGALGFLPRGVPPERVFVNSVDADTFSARQGLRPEDELVAVNGQNISDMTIRELKGPLSRRPVSLTFRRSEVVEKEKLQGKGEAGGRLGNRGSLKSDLSSSTGGGLADLLLRHSAGHARDCEVSRLLHRVFGVAKQGAEGTNEVYLHRLVTQNWIEEIEDLNLVEDKHYEDWNFPEKIVVVLKQELAEYQAANGLNIVEQAASARVCIVSSASDLYAWGCSLIFGEDDGAASSDSGGKRVVSQRTRRL